MNLYRKYRSGVLFFIALVIYLLSPLALTCSKSGLVETIPLNGMVSLSSKGLHLFPCRIVDSKLSHKRRERNHSGSGFSLAKVRSILPEDKTAKLIFLKNSAALSGYYSPSLSRPFRLCAFHPVRQAPSPGFQLSYSGLSPPPA